MNPSQARRQYGVEFGKLTTTKDSVGEYTLYEDGRVVAQGWCDSAAQMKADYVEREIGRRIPDDVDYDDEGY